MDWGELVSLDVSKFLLSVIDVVVCVVSCVLVVSCRIWRLSQIRRNYRFDISSLQVTSDLTYHRYRVHIQSPITGYIISS